MIPVLLCIDLEPEERTFDVRDAAEWRGVRQATAYFTELRRRVEDRTRRPAAFSWFVKMDPQIHETYGSAGWAATRYRECIAELETAGDEIGLHVHAWRRGAGRAEWIQDFADERWIAHCLESGFRAFRHAFDRAPISFRFGDHWMSQPAMDLIRQLGARRDLTIEPGRVGTTAREGMTGAYPDYSAAPRRPYWPATQDYLSPAARRSDDFLIVPVSTARTEWAVTPLSSAHGTTPATALEGSAGGFEGYHDVADERMISGWVWDAGCPSRRLDVDIFDGDRPVATVGATGHRPDLEAAGKGDGRYAFRWPTPAALRDGRPHDIHVRVAGTNVSLLSTPRTVNGLAAEDAEAVTLYLEHDPFAFRLLVDRLLASSETAHLSFPLRADACAHPDRFDCVASNVEYLLTHPLADEFVFSTAASATAE